MGSFIDHGVTLFGISPTEWCKTPLALVRDLVVQTIILMGSNPIASLLHYFYGDAVFYSAAPGL